MPPPANDEPSEDYVAELLKNDARRLLNARNDPVSSRWPDATTRKPNLRFLNNIIRETDTHNSALKLRELEQAGDRLRRLRGDPPRERSDHRRNYDYRSPSPNRERKRRRSRSRSHSRSREFRDRDRERRDRRRRRSRSPRHGYRGLTNSGERRDYEGRTDRVRDTARHRGREEDSRHTSAGSERHPVDSLDYLRRRVQDSVRGHSRLSSGSLEDTRDERSKERRRRSSHERRRDRNIERNSDERRGAEHRTSSLSQKPSTGEEERSQPVHDTKCSTRSPTSPATSSQPPSQPPDAPPAQITRRGRGAHTTSASAMDARFLSSYDPSIDVQPISTDADGDDWDRALEVARDRAAWKRTQADRLQTAGVTLQQIENWERGEKERSEEDVVWRAKGQRREWDVGKVVGSDGVVETRATWAKRAMPES